MLTGTSEACVSSIVDADEKQEAQLPQRNRASAAHINIGWLTDLLMITHSRLVVQCRVYGKIAAVVFFFDIQTL